MNITEQQWDDESFCDNYEQTWEISCGEVHYGWLADGEDKLGLLSELNKKEINVLDVGCGMAHNLIALSKQGAIGYGVDISSCMLSKAYDLIDSEGLVGRIVLEHGDMRDFDYFPEVSFDVVLSVYSMEYLSGVQELRKVLAHIYNALNDGGVFIMCFSHPSQVHRYPELLSSSKTVGVGKYKTFNYSYRDATQALIKCGFHIERVIEQKTHNPSQITYRESKKYPYHFHEGRNPCDSSYDDFSNKSPHTVIYKATKPVSPASTGRRKYGSNLGFRKLWGYRRKINKIESFRYLGYPFKALFLEPMDNVLGVLDVVTIKIGEKVATNIDRSILVETYDTHEEFRISSDSVLGIIHNALDRRGLIPRYRALNVNTEDTNMIERRVLIESIEGLEEKVEKVFSTKRIGLLIFVNSEEPVSGELSTDSIRARLGDIITLSYIALGKKGSIKGPFQIDLFG